jgi:hypothetical protein
MSLCTSRNALFLLLLLLLLVVVFGLVSPLRKAQELMTPRTPHSSTLSPWVG